MEGIMTDADTIRAYLSRLAWQGADHTDVARLSRMLEQAVEALEEIATGRYATKTFTRDKHANNALAAIAKEASGE